MLHFYHLHKFLFPEKAWKQITSKLMLSIFNRRRVTNNMQIRSEIVSKFSNALKFLSNN